MCTGYAMDTDGVWRHHSWMLNAPLTAPEPSKVLGQAVDETAVLLHHPLCL